MKRGKLWDHTRPLRELPVEVHQFFIEEARELKREFLENRLQVVLIPAPEPMYAGHMVRAVENKNPDWYRAAYNDWSKCQGKSNCKRTRMHRALDRVCTGRDGVFGSYRFRYDSILREIMQDRLMEGYQSLELWVPPSNTVLEYFGQDLVDPCREEVFGWYDLDENFDEPDNVPF
ncbi:hypothetical protein GF342_03645 [Candidatus Woesearchaeota archaeon]|nr:hypothetical protein [Candidatus Woesearchaeota archaeon]